MTDRERELLIIENERNQLEISLNKLIETIGPVAIANRTIMPYGWRKAAKGRTVWRILEEIISQNLEVHSRELGFSKIKAAESEVGVYDFEFSFPGGATSYVNIKSSVKGGKRNKDDISKAVGLIDFYNQNPEAKIYIATFVIEFCDDMTINIEKSIVMPINWIPDVYVNPSNNGNLQSADYKNISLAEKRTNIEFITALHEENEVAQRKKRAKR